jgi:hypothetical protein
MNDSTKNEKIVVASPDLAVRLYDKAPAHTRNRIFTLPKLKARQVFVIDYDEARRQGLIS